ncbi:hypothetical protein [Roseinatronobacter monicus]|uniref:Uncharacterized protein n=1 Tax=Roseinatronobacter monicus TaxID=393481 RepID=A0A543K3P6_9RHOB|nr:hypothetical protein [Roseinatronobacter monicus]TQM89686.1 hypothetical protein BD293_4356 [Roseinatronobacter monicus]
MKLFFRIFTDDGPLQRKLVNLVHSEGSTARELASVATNTNGYGIFTIPLDRNLLGRAKLSLQIGRRIIELDVKDIEHRHVVPIHISLEEAKGLPEAKLPWHISPIDISDIDLIPGIFPDLGDGVFGEGYCERLLPTDQAPLVQELTHLVKTTRNVQECDGELQLDEGRMLHFKARWDFLGYSLGTLLKSVSLLPCEKVSFAVRDWQHGIRQFAEEGQTDQQIQTASLSQMTSVSEVMHATSRSFEAGLGVEFSIPQISLGISAAASYSHATYNTNMQSTLSNLIQSSASASRSTHRVSLIEVSEQHSQSEALRTICNNNHCHTLNVFFRAVLENYRLTTRAMGWREVYFVHYEVKEFTAESALCAQHLLAENLLEPQLAECFAALANQTYAPIDDTDPDANDVSVDSKTNRIRITLRIGGNGLGKNRPIMLSLQMKNGNVLDFSVSRAARWKRNSDYTHFIDISPVKPEDIDKIGLKNDSGYRVDISSISFAFLDSQGGWTAIASGSFGIFRSRSQKYLTSVYQAPASNDEQENPMISDHAAESARQDAICAARLLAHLNCNKHYYNQLLWLGEDINERLCRFEKIQCGENVLADLVKPQPIGVFGCSVAFPKADSVYVDEPLPPDESLITLATSGVYADSALGRCTSCETKDDDVYWDWSESPCNCGNALTAPGNVTNVGLPTTPPFVNNGQAANLIQGLKGLGVDIGASALGSLLETLVKTNTSLLKDLLEAVPKDSNDDEPPEDSNGEGTSGD